jgi:hypothetical protein
MLFRYLIAFLYESVIIFGFHIFKLIFPSHWVLTAFPYPVAALINGSCFGVLLVGLVLAPDFLYERIPHFQDAYNFCVEVWNMPFSPDHSSGLDKALPQLQDRYSWKPGLCDVPEIVDLPVEEETGEQKVADAPIPDASARRRGHIRLYMAGFLIMVLCYCCCHPKSLELINLLGVLEWGINSKEFLPSSLWSVVTLFLNKQKN